MTLTALTSFSALLGMLYTVKAVIQDPPPTALCSRKWAEPVNEIVPGFRSTELGATGRIGGENQQQAARQSRCNSEMATKLLRHTPKSIK